MMTMRREKENGLKVSQIQINKLKVQLIKTEVK
jgi:hypothetical protein